MAEMTLVSLFTCASFVILVFYQWDLGFRCVAIKDQSGINQSKGEGASRESVPYHFRTDLYVRTYVWESAGRESARTRKLEIHVAINELLWSTTLIY